DKGAHKQELFKYIKLLRLGNGTDEAFKEAFKCGYEEMERALRLYMSDPVYPVLKYRLDTTLSEKDFALRSFEEAEAQVRLGYLLLRTDQVEEAEKYFKRAAESDGKLSGIEEGLGFIAFKRNRYTEAVEHFKKAAALGSKNYLAHYQCAYAVYLEPTKDETYGLSS